MKTNVIICGDSCKVLKDIPDNSIDLVVTSPPYDQLRTYNGYTVDLHTIGTELYRVLKDGGVVAMVIQDSTKDFGKSLTSFRTIVDWCDNIGFKLFETCIYRKNGTEGAWWTQRFRVDHEYMPLAVVNGIECKATAARCALIYGVGEHLDPEAKVIGSVLNS